MLVSLMVPVVVVVLYMLDSIKGLGWRIDCNVWLHGVLCTGTLFFIHSYSKISCLTSLEDVGEETDFITYVFIDETQIQHFQNHIANKYRKNL